MTHCRFSGHYWEDVLTMARRSAPIHVWRNYMQGVYQCLVRDWLPAVEAGRSLKTDLFEEAVTPHYLLADLGPRGIGIDVSLGVVQAARKRLASDQRVFSLLVGDVRQLPIKSGTIEHILSGSSLDHFFDKSDIAASLAELVRVLYPGGILVVTFDNPHNPVVRLRNRLPCDWLNRSGLVPYYVGATYGREEACQQLKALGLRVTEVTAVAHVPRAPAIWLSVLVERVGWKLLESVTLRVLDAFEILKSWPTRYWTGYYLAIKAVKPVNSLDTNDFSMT